MRKRINPIGFLSIVSSISILGIFTKNPGWFGFLGFLFYLRYFWVIPDESFWKNIEKSATIAFLVQLFALIPTLMILGLFIKRENYIPESFGICFSIAVLCFTLSVTILEWKEFKGISHD